MSTIPSPVVRISTETPTSSGPVIEPDRNSPPSLVKVEKAVPPPLIKVERTKLNPIKVGENTPKTPLEEPTVSSSSSGNTSPSPQLVKASNDVSKEVKKMESKKKEEKAEKEIEYLKEASVEEPARANLVLRDHSRRFKVVKKVIPPNWEADWVSRMDNLIEEIGSLRDDDLDNGGRGPCLYFESSPTNNSVEGRFYFPMEALEEIDVVKGCPLQVSDISNRVNGKNPLPLVIEKVPLPNIVFLVVGFNRAMEEISIVGMIPSRDKFFEFCREHLTRILDVVSPIGDDIRAGSIDYGMVKRSIKNVVARYQLTIRVSATRSTMDAWRELPDEAVRYKAFDSRDTGMTVYEWLLVAVPSGVYSDINLQEMMNHL